MLDFALTLGRVLATLVGIWATFTFVRQLAVISRRVRALSKRFVVWRPRGGRRKKRRRYMPAFGFGRYEQRRRRRNGRH